LKGEERFTLERKTTAFFWPRRAALAKEVNLGKKKGSAINIWFQDGEKSAVPFGRSKKSLDREWFY